MPGGGLKIKFKDLKHDSKFKKVVAAIKKPLPAQKALNLYCNFELTKSRNNLLYEVRKAVRENKLAKYFVDFNGEISVLVNLDDKDQLKRGWVRWPRPTSTGAPMASSLPGPGLLSTSASGSAPKQIKGI